MLEHADITMYYYIYRAIQLSRATGLGTEKGSSGGGINLGGMVETGSERTEEREEGKESDQEGKPDISLGEMVRREVRELTERRRGRRERRVTRRRGRWRRKGRRR